jgi:hypothetical protein
MSVDQKHFDREVEENIPEDSGIVKSRCPTKDYKLSEKDVKGSSEFAEAGNYAEG